MNVMPRYTFRKGKCCPDQKHAGQTDCMCDVHVTSIAPIYTGVHPCAELALKELDDHHVTRENFLEFASVMLGIFELAKYREEHPQERPIGNGPAEWRGLPEETQINLRHHYRIGTPWAIAQEEIDDPEMQNNDVIRKYYADQRSWNIRIQRTQRFVERMEEKSDKPCAWCGAMMFDVPDKRRTCNERCKVYLSRSNAKARKLAESQVPV